MFTVQAVIQGVMEPPSQHRCLIIRTSENAKKDLFHLRKPQFGRRVGGVLIRDYFSYADSGTIAMVSALDIIIKARRRWMMDPKDFQPPVGTAVLFRSYDIQYESTSRFA